MLQTELLKLQLHLRKHKQRLLILFEGGNTAGKGSNAIRIEAFPNRIKGPYSDHKVSASGLFS
ncbi:MAG: hypothetical protein GVY26_10545 [Bacteroidetes bacterium]|nr:hypothetical protein [Bacteroidota bacterium]